MATVLLVGGETALITIMRWMLEDEGYVVAQASRGEAALAELRTRVPAMVVVLLTTYPSANCAAVLEAAVADSALRRHAFVLVTGVPRQLPARWDELVDVLSMPVIAKPFHINSVLRVIGDAAAQLSPAEEARRAGQVEV